MKLHKIFIGFMALAIILSFSACPNKAQNPTGTSGGSAGSGTTPTVDTTTKPDIPSGEYMCSAGMHDTVFFVDKEAGKLTWVEYIYFNDYEYASTAALAKAAYDEGTCVWVYEECNTYEDGAYKITVEGETYKLYLAGSTVYLAKIYESETGSGFFRTNLVLVDDTKKAMRVRPAAGQYVSATTVKIEGTDYYLYAVVGGLGGIKIKKSTDGSLTGDAVSGLDDYFDTQGSASYEFTSNQLIYSSGTSSGWTIRSNSSLFKIKKEGVFSYVEMNKINN